MARDEPQKELSEARDESQKKLGAARDEQQKELGEARDESQKELGAARDEPQKELDEQPQKLSIHRVFGHMNACKTVQLPRNQEYIDFKKLFIELLFGWNKKWP